MGASIYVVIPINTLFNSRLCVVMAITVAGQAERDVNVCTEIFPSLTTSVSVASATHGFASHARYATSRTVLMLVILNAGQNAGSAPSRKALKKPVISSRPRKVLSGVTRAELSS